jgi:YggT family protein
MLLASWAYAVPNFILAALMYTLLGRAILGLMVDANSKNYIWRFFCRLTDPVIVAIRPVTPLATPPVILWLFGVVWLFWLRVLLLNLFLMLGKGAA